MGVSKKSASECPIDATLAVIDGRWKATILWRLLDGPMRTAELRRSIPDITERMLIRHLKEMVADGILDRHDARTVPPCVHYTISEYGRTLTPVLEALCKWGHIHLGRENATTTSGASSSSSDATARTSRINDRPGRRGETPLCSEGRRRPTS